MRKRLFTLRMTNAEMTKLEANAFAVKMKVSEYARAALLGAPAKVDVVLPKVNPPRERADYEVVPNHEQ